MSDARKQIGKVFIKVNRAELISQREPAIPKLATRLVSPAPNAGLKRQKLSFQRIGGKNKDIKKSLELPGIARGRFGKSHLTLL
ncbi:MAG: hypothetical protein IPM55_08260 [Acidobacteria bacterium]|nr:hypothetical protein [Acidobacteriota bacterium]